jgi:DNA-binding ferritin-like protein
MVTDVSGMGQKYAKIMPNHLGESTFDLETFSCICGKQYLHRQGLWRHKKKCSHTSEQQEEPLESKEKDEPTDKELIMMLLKQNSELIKEQADLKEIILEIVKNGTINNSNNTTTNSHNKAFNLNLFLNETCKNAMNITDFVDSIKLQLSDFMSMGEIGFVEGISNIIVKNLNSLDETVRPIHCTDQKRETFYVKDKNIWEKDDDEKKKMKQMVKSVAYKNEKLIKTYKEKYPDYNNPDSKRSDQYSKIMIEAMDCKDDSREKIIKNISKAITIKSK